MSLITAVAAPLISGLFSRKANKSSGGAAAQNNANAAAQGLYDNSSRAWDFYQKNYQPLESSLIQDAQNAGSAAEYARASSIAAGDVGNAFANVRGARARDMAGMGLDPSDGRYQAQGLGLDIAQGASSAGAQNRARSSVREMAWKKKMGVAAMGRGAAAAAMGGMSDAARVNAGLADAAGQRAQQVGAGAGSILGGLTDAIGNWRPTGGGGGGGGGYGTIDPTQSGIDGPW